MNISEKKQRPARQDETDYLNSQTKPEEDIRNQDPWESKLSDETDYLKSQTKPEEDIRNQDPWESSKGPPGRTGSPPGAASSTNLPASCCHCAGRLTGLFAQFGPLRMYHAAMRDDGEVCGGFGCVVFERHEDAEKAIDELNCYYVDGHSLRVDWVYPSP
ncbi:hypothetical protein E2562_033380 [Oryza meyeriana var. granulata]|uniref:RRM domain-containing protein n=1 Tax=Oryza meyeriana var. granulata TaxID=110450 RepID=A0A6G1C1C3_9ORYZ|nr:hypothetical protein E2562_033380 [Oryza meyeriana var. granulata]